MRDWNARSLPGQKAEAGASCLAVQGRTAYLAQVGPSVAYHVGDGRFRRIVPEEEAGRPLGQGDQAQPSFSRFQLSPGDLILIAPPQIEELLEEAALRSILLRGADAALTELFRLAREQQDFALVLLACVVEPEPPAPAPEPERERTEIAAIATEGGLRPELAPAEAGMPPEGLEQPLVRLKGADADIRYPRTTGGRRGLPRIPPLALWALFILLTAGLLAWLFIPAALQESKDDRFAALVAEARVALNVIEASDDRAERRQLLQGAEASLAEAEALQPGEADVTDLRERLRAALTELNAIVELPALELIVDVGEQLPGAVSLTELELGGDGAYFLDRGQGRVIAITLAAPNPEPVVLLQEGSAVGSETASLPQHIAWAEELGALLILDDARRLISVAPGEEPRLRSVRGAQAWGSADGIAYANESLYVLDREGDQVWRYLPTETGFDSERQPLLTAVDLEHATDIAVDDALYLVMENGAIVSARFGVEEAFSQAGIDLPLNSPASPAPLPASDRLLVADRGNERIVVFSLTGDFLQQWVSATTFTDLRAIAADGDRRLLYILDGAALSQTQLLPPP